jgi:hypothetical protein
VGGNWLLWGSATVAITPAATALLAGYSKGVFNLVTTWSDGTASRLFAGDVWVAQTAP